MKQHPFLSIQEDFEDMLKDSDELRQRYENNEMSTEDVLRAISLYKCQKAVEEVNIYFNRITDGKNNNNVYIQARGSMPYRLGKRKWVGVYLGKEKDIVDSTGSVSPHWKIKGGKLVREKILNELKTELNLY